MDYEGLFEELLNSREKVSDDCNLTKETVDQLLIVRTQHGIKRLLNMYWNLPEVELNLKI